jgi:Tol biopolymer transport system component
MRSAGKERRSGAPCSPHAALVAAIVVILSTTGVACRDSTGPARGTIEVTVTSTGSDVDPDGYLVTVDSRLTRHVAANAAITFADIDAGEHSLLLGSVASNCTVGDANPRSVTVLAEATVTAPFPVACTSRTGSMRITINTTGAGLDPDGYSLRVDNGPEHSVATNDVLDLTDMKEGIHTLFLGDVARNCTVSGASGRTLPVVFANTTAVQFSIGCLAYGTLTITTTTRGSDLDQDGYTVNVSNGDDYVGQLYTVAVPANGSVSVPDIPVGEYGLGVVGSATNCQLDSGNPNHIVIAELITTSASLNIRCFGKGTLIITGATTGVDLDPDGYSVSTFSRLGAGSHTATVPTNGAVSLPDIVGGPYALAVSGWAANCELAGTYPRDIVVDDKGPTSVSLNVSCAAARRLAFVLTDGGHTDVYTINSNGTGSTRLTTNAAADENPAWSPDGATIAFATNRDGSYRIYVMNADGSNQRPLSSNAANARQPAWSPDGQKIAFVGSAGGHPELYVMNADGTNVVRLTDSAGNDSDPAWSPDGRKIAFRSDRTGGAELYVMNADGSNLTRLTTTAVDESKPAWSPDGSKIVFAAGGCDFYYGCYSDLYIMKADGSGTSPLTSNSISSSPAWSSDGVWVAFVMTPCDSHGQCVDRVAMVKSNGTGGGTITEGAGTQPAWRP